MCLAPLEMLVIVVFVAGGQIYEFAEAPIFPPE
jgi:hypothetical protein